MGSLQTDRRAPSSTKAQLLDVAEQLFLAAGPGRLGTRHHRRRRPERRRHPLPLRFPRRPRRRGDRAAGRRSGGPSPRRARRVAARPGTAVHPRRDPGPRVRLRRAGGGRRARRPSAGSTSCTRSGSTVRLRSPSCRSTRARSATGSASPATRCPPCRSDVFDARLALAIETIIVGLRTPSPAPGRHRGEAARGAAAPGPSCSSISSSPDWKDPPDVVGAHRGARTRDPPRHHEPPRAAQRA